VAPLTIEIFVGFLTAPFGGSGAQPVEGCYVQAGNASGNVMERHTGYSGLDCSLRFIIRDYSTHINLFKVFTNERIQAYVILRGQYPSGKRCKLETLALQHCTILESLKA